MRPRLRRDGLRVFPLRACELEAAVALCARAFGPAARSVLAASFHKYLLMKRVQDRRRGRGRGRKLQYLTISEDGRAVGVTGLYSVPFESLLGKWRTPGDAVVLRLGWSAFREAPRERGRGYGGDWIQIVEELARREGAAHLAVETSGDFPFAMGLYGRMGYRRGWSGVPDYFGPGRTLYTVYRPLGGAEERAVAGGRLVSLPPGAAVARRADIRRLCGSDGARVRALAGHVAATPRRHASLRLEFLALLDDRSRMLAIADVSQAFWVGPQTRFTRHLHARDRESLAALLAAAHAYLRRAGARLHVIHLSDPERLAALTGDLGFMEAKGSIPGFYASAQSAPAEFFVKSLALQGPGGEMARPTESARLRRQNPR